MGASCGMLIWLCQKYRHDISQIPKWLFILMLAWVGVKLLYILSETENCWQPDKSKKFVPIVIMLLASVSAGKGSKQVLNLTAILAAACVTGLAVISVIAIPEADIRLANQSSKWWSAEFAAASLLPISISILPQEKGKKNWKGFAAVAASCVVITVVINGVLSPWMVGNYENPFYEMSKALSILNLARRFEVIVASMMITGWFVTCAIYQSAATEVIDSLTGGKSKLLNWVMTLTIIGIYLLDLSVGAETVLIADSVMIISAVPVHMKNKKEKPQKSEKSS